MCGIVGFITSEEVSENHLHDMVNTLSHRGPNDKGHYKIKELEQDIFLGHTRLSILDISNNAHQPMFNEDKNVILIFNGEIYNYVEIRDELKMKGHKFTSTGDTEVVLKSYLEWGTECFRKFNGMWAISLYDKKLHKTILSRDRYGVKPLFYHKNNNSFIYSSEIKSLLKFPNIAKEPNYEKIFRYVSRHYRYVDIDNDTFFKNIIQVPKGCFLEVDNSFNIKITKYWSLQDQITKNNDSDLKVVDDFRNLFIDAVKIRLRSDVEVSCMLSGGLDSTSIASVASKILKKPLTTFSAITGDEKGVYDESDYIKLVAEDINATSHYLIPEPSDMFETINEMLEFHDEPICTATWHMGYLISKDIKEKNISVVLNGHGGDELLAGYWDHYHYYFHTLKKENKLDVLNYEINRWKENHNRNQDELIISEEYINDLLNDKTSETSKFHDYSNAFNMDFQNNYKLDVKLKDISDNILTNRLHKELFFETVPSSLRAEDRNTMSQSIEARSPFLDYRLAEFCYSLPDRFKIREGVGKWLLRESMKGILHEEVRTRKDKAGFKSPTEIWFQTINKGQIYTLIRSKSFINRGIFDTKYIEEIFEEHLNTNSNHQMFLWQVINIELWFRIFFDEED